MAGTRPRCADVIHRSRPLSWICREVPRSAAIGREIIQRAGLEHRVEHRDGDALQTDLGTGFDAALCFNLIHHLDEHQIKALLRKIHAALNPGGTLAILDLFATPAKRRPTPEACCLGLFFHLSSGTTVYSPEQLTGWLQESRIRCAPTRAAASHPHPGALRMRQATGRAGRPDIRRMSAPPPPPPQGTSAGDDPPATRSAGVPEPSAGTVQMSLARPSRPGKA
ncbi:SAM-dependent methyltransferase [Streptomyces sp. H27-D2]|uniref:SAM-dependent methyltransferase n=1 Tax=Streptomyces sp. H27-D2 TaxID=3046304 RepID=UPI002DBD54D6|nr:class I SAM-dependent methyltransferase [Streptomyces sp. H27-D2]MEC4015453.1 class I SAM-dependent methyltransferase [Streptomyces sp. H27-D2]